MLFQDREDAGRQLAERLSRYRDADPMVLALPRGGVAVGCEVARALGAPLDVLVARKLNAPSHPELGIGAIAPGGVRVLDDPAIQAFQVSEAQLAEINAAETAELERRLQRYRGDRPSPGLRDRTVILVDDGLATGLTARAAIQAIRQSRPRRLVLAVPVGAPATVDALRAEVEELICIATPLNLMAVSYWYHEFEPLTDRDVVALLEQAMASASRPAGAVERGEACSEQPLPPVLPSPSAGSGGGLSERVVRAPAGSVGLEGDLALPAAARGVIVFAHGSGSDRRSPRHRAVAGRLHAAGFGTLLLDLLTPQEAAVDAVTREHRFDIDRLAQRLMAGVDWMTQQAETRSLPIGLFGASTGAAAALITAAECPGVVRAVISRGGRLDLVGPALERVRAPALLIVGGSDLPVLRLNREAFQSLAGEKKLIVVPGAGHLFEEPGAIEAIAALTTDWLSRHLAPA